MKHYFGFYSDAENIYFFNRKINPFLLGFLSGAAAMFLGIALA
jgi:hypothetical protein